MALFHAKSGEIIDLQLGVASAITRRVTLLNTGNLEVIRFVIPAGREIPTHTVTDQMTIQCMEGRVLLIARGRSQELAAGRLLYLAAAEPHSIKALVDSSLLVTILSTKRQSRRSFDVAEGAPEP